MVDIFLFYHGRLFFVSLFLTDLSSLYIFVIFSFCENIIRYRSSRSNRLNIVLTISSSPVSSSCLCPILNLPCYSHRAIGVLFRYFSPFNPNLLIEASRPHRQSSLVYSFLKRYTHNMADAAD